VSPRGAAEEPVDWKSYLAEFHRARAGVAEAVLSRALAGDHSPYRWLARAVSADATVIVDLASGSGPVSRELAQPGRTVVGLDLSADELALAAARGPGPWVQGDALRLPFRDGAFDAVTISFGLRNVADPLAGLAEMRRVTRPGGRLVVCEFSAITIAPADMLYRRYLLHVLPAIARRAARNPEAYEYLAESIVDWPAQPELAGLIKTAGWSAVRWRNLSLGAVAVHVARRA